MELTKFQVHYSRELKKNPLSEEILVRILKISKNVRLQWGSEYANFIFMCPLLNKNMDLDEALDKFHSDNYTVGLCPEYGSSTILGRHIPVKIYTFKEFCDISNDADFLVAMYAPIEKCKTDLEDFSLFQRTRLTSYIDYPQIITNLENEGYIETFPSENILRVDGRRFSLTEKCSKLFPRSEEYIGQSYEVDSLGTKYHSDLTDNIKLLSLGILKPWKTEDKPEDE